MCNELSIYRYARGRRNILSPRQICNNLSWYAVIRVVMCITFVRPKERIIKVFRVCVKDRPKAGSCMQIDLVPPFLFGGVYPSPVSRGQESSTSQLRHVSQPCLSRTASQAWRNTLTPFLSRLQGPRTDFGSRKSTRRTRR